MVRIPRAELPLEEGRLSSPCFNLSSVCQPECGDAHVSVESEEARRGHQRPRAGDTGSSEAPDVSAEN